jgi:transketolase
MVTDRPMGVVADTVKGKGVSFMEHTRLRSRDAFYRYHSGAPAAEDYRRAVQELLDRVNKGLEAAGAAPLALETPPPAEAAAAGGDNLQKLVPAYGEALLRAAEANPAIVALDADLVLDTGLIPFKERFPDRFIECGIAEQDMVSQAGGFALSGLLPVVHSFACFLTTRPNEQIYNNATERTKVIYAGSLAGLIPAGPGHSHQSLRDIALLGAVPGLVLVSPACEAEVDALVDYAVNGTGESVYLRLESVPCAVPFALPGDHRPVEGRGYILHEGGDAAVFAYGPVMASQCVLAARALTGKGLGLRVVDLPWLNRIDADWLGRAVAGVRAVFTVDNHYVAGGQGAMIAAALAAAGAAVPVHRLGVTDVPACGRTEEVLEFHGLDARSLARTIENRTPGA